MELKSCELPLRLLPMLTKTQNDPKSAKTNRNKPKRPKKIAKQSKVKLTAQMPKFGCFGPRSINFLFFQGNFACSLFRMCWFQVWHWFWKFLEQIPGYGHFLSKSINFLILTKFCLYPISKALISNLTFWPSESPSSSISEQKVLTFLS